jgi:hypothetical protein
MGDIQSTLSEEDRILLESVKEEVGQAEALMRRFVESKHGQHNLKKTVGKTRWTEAASFSLSYSKASQI